MSTISATNSNTQSRWNYYKDFANMVCSRESTYRTALDITAFDAPMMLADVFRGFKKFLESTLEGVTGTVMVVVSPILTGWVGKFIGKFILSKERQKDTLQYLKFSMSELRDYEKFKIAKNRIRSEEVEDKHFIASLYKQANKTKKSEYYETEAENVKDFCDRFKPTEDTMKEIYKFKKATIVGESLVEGGFWGGYGLILRGFRKYILQEDRFTGTKGYVSDEESEQLGESGGLNLFQKVVGVAAMFVSPILNLFLLNKVEDREAVKNSRFLQMVDNNLETTHGVYPKLGLLFTQTTIPKWISIITLSQGWFERIERILKLCTVIPSWWLGHRVTNGTIALNADKELSKKYNVNPGILIEPECLKPAEKNEDTFFERIQKRFPEPAKIHHVLKSTEGEGKEELHKEAEDLHAECLYKGFALHSLLVFGLNMAVNYSTKLRALWALKN